MNDNDGGKESSSDDGQTETQPRRCKRGGEQQAKAPQQSASTDPDGVGEENTPEVNSDIISASDITLAADIIHSFLKPHHL
ncbi:unnamed protein product [Trifolium pratense]|uniref:Uncharacterized protein n=1 Tax=Trifolium pratense TaxID=57577 RepID=A0ACB0M9R1_TRIPR|nr:unnamed protein product [Trifolium pratense]